MDKRVETIIAELEANRGPPEDLAGMARYGINTERALGVRIPVLRAMAKAHRPDPALAKALWATGIHEARILAGMIDDPAAVTIEQMEDWAADFDSWDLCDQVCSNLFRQTPHAADRAHAWAERDETFVRRAGFTLMAGLAAIKGPTPDATFLGFLPAIERRAGDERNFVKKAVNWALRQIGKRNAALNRAAIETAMRIGDQDSRSARWVASNALRELRSPAVQARLAAKRS